MTEPFVLGNVAFGPDDNTKTFLEKYKDQFQIDIHSQCKIEPEIIEVKVRSVTPTDTGITIEFASEEDANLYWTNYQKIPIRMTFI